MKYFIFFLLLVNFSSCYINHKVSTISEPDQIIDSNFYEYYVDPSDGSSIVYVYYENIGWFMNYNIWRSSWLKNGYIGCYKYYTDNLYYCDNHFSYLYFNSYRLGNPDCHPYQAHIDSKINNHLEVISTFRKYNQIIEEHPESINVKSKISRLPSVSGTVLDHSDSHITISGSQKNVHVRDYYRKNGTHVNSYYRSSPHSGGHHK